MHNLLIGLQVICCGILIVSILLQPSKASGFTTMTTSTTDSFYSKNKSRTYEVMLVRVTSVSAALFFAITIAINTYK